MAGAGGHNRRYCHYVAPAKYEEQRAATPAHVDACVPATALLLPAASCARLSARHYSASLALQLAQGVRMRRLCASPAFTAWAERKAGQRRRRRLLAALTATVLLAVIAALTSWQSAPASPQLLALPTGREPAPIYSTGIGQDAWRSPPAASRALALPCWGVFEGLPAGGSEPQLVWEPATGFSSGRKRLAALPQLALPAACGTPAAASSAAPRILSPHVTSAKSTGPPEGPAGQALAVLAPLTRDFGPLPRGGPSALALGAGSGRAQVLPWRSLWGRIAAPGTGLPVPDSVLRRAYAAGRWGCAAGLRLTGWAARAAFRAIRSGSQVLRQRLAARGDSEGSPGDGLRLALGPGRGPVALASQCPVPQWHVPVGAAPADGLAGGAAGSSVDAESLDSAAAIGAATSGAELGTGGAAKGRAPSAAAQPTCPRATPWRMAALAAARPPQGGAQLGRVQQPACQAAGYWRAPAAPACLPGDVRPLLAAEAASGAGPAAQTLPHSQGPAAPARKSHRVFPGIRAASAAVLRLLMVGLGVAVWVARSVWQRLGMLAALLLAAICWRKRLPQPCASAGGGGGSPSSASAAPRGEPGHERPRTESATKARQCSLFECRSKRIV